MDPLVVALATSSIESALIELLPVFIVAAGVGIFVAKVGRFPYTVALLLAGLAISIIGFEVEIRLTHDLIFLVLLPPLLFEGAATTDLERLRRNLLVVLLIAVVGLIASVAFLGWVGRSVFGFELLVALLFATMILPTDPVSVLALFEEVGAPERLAVLVEGESLVNDGVGVVLFTTTLAIIESGAGPATVFAPAGLAEVALEIAVVSLGGLLVGIATGYGVYSVMVNLDEHMTEIVLTFVLAYGSFLLAEHFLGVSGVIATVAAGLFIGNRGAEYAMSPQTKVSIFSSLDTAAFVVNTFVFLMIGVATPVSQLVAHGELILLAIPLVLVARALVVYPLSALANLVVEPDVSRSYQHVMVWAGLHGSIPIALVLGVRPDQYPMLPVEELRAMVFGVAAFSLVVQAVTLPPLLSRLGVTTRAAEEELYELLLGRARAVDAALEAAEDLRDAGEVPTQVYQAFTAEYEREKAELADAIGQLLAEHPALRFQRQLAGERQLLRREKGAVMDAARDGVVADDVAEDLLEEVDLKLDRVRDGTSTVGGAGEEAYGEFWRRRAREFGLDVPEPPSEDE